MNKLHNERNFYQKIYQKKLPIKIWICLQKIVLEQEALTQN